MALLHFVFSSSSSLADGNVSTTVFQDSKRLPGIPFSSNSRRVFLSSGQSYPVALRGLLQGVLTEGFRRAKPDRRGSASARRGNPFPRPLGVQGDQKGPRAQKKHRGFAVLFLCPKRESNPHGFKGHWILSPARLPIPPSGLGWAAMPQKDYKGIQKTRFIKFFA